MPYLQKWTDNFNVPHLALFLTSIN